MPVKKEDSGGMSVFERRRLENIKANKEVLTDISKTAKRVMPERPAPKPAPRPKRTSDATPTRRNTPRATRTSSRLAGIGADDETLKRKMEVENENQAMQAKAKKMRHNGDLNLGDIAVEGRKFGNGVAGIKDLFRGAEPGVRTFTEDDVTETTDKSLKELREQMSALELYEHWLPNAEGDDDEDTKPLDPVISAFTTHTRTITGFVFPPNDSNAVYTSSYDSSIRKMDLEKGTSVQIWAPEDHDEDLPLSALDMPPNEPNMLYFSTLSGLCGRYDIRDPKSTDIWRLSDHKIGGFSLHPLQPHLLATASLDRTLKIWDCRKITGKGDLRHPALMGEHESRLSVSHASWSAGGHLATSSYDDTIKIHAFPECSTWKTGHDITPASMEPTHKVRHNNQTGRWVTILKPQWQRAPRDGIQKFVIGNMNRFVDVFASDGSQLAQLDGEGITAVPAVAHFHPSQRWVAGGNGSGKLCLWR
ncbi:WD repeat containing protein [Emericellopsis cladophorae]|uniref:DNA damage-binding protein CMR1 n=1 Tax=Emericellopsis cladophorae TaxID=2686198 RepID=A0A9P9XZS9_9HYPO|nr:WD repeat containing protein [Emericellopsis cladophorae]KAI6780676.1 WD repeat containing protein [Emericellopsis cladophorae]